MNAHSDGTHARTQTRTTAAARRDVSLSPDDPCLLGRRHERNAVTHTGLLAHSTTGRGAPEGRHSSVLSQNSSWNQNRATASQSRPQLAQENQPLASNSRQRGRHLKPDPGADRLWGLGLLGQSHHLQGEHTCPAGLGTCRQVSSRCRVRLPLCLLPEVPGCPVRQGAGRPGLRTGTAPTAATPSSQPPWGEAVFPPRLPGEEAGAQTRGAAGPGHRCSRSVLEADSNHDSKKAAK